MKTCSVILAAGDGKRMKSAHPKVLCEVLFDPMISWVADCVQDAGIRHNCVVVGDCANEIRAVLPAEFETVEQKERHGTGHAVMMAERYIRYGNFADVAVLCGDAPLLPAQDLKAAYEAHKQAGNAVTVLSAKVSDPTGYGRIVRTINGVSAITEERDADADTRQIQEINSGAYWFNAEFLLSCFHDMTNENDQGEYYLTDAVAIAISRNCKVDAYLASPDAVLGANDRRSLQTLNTIARRRVLDTLLDDGVNIPFEDGIVVGRNVNIGQDTTILPGSILQGKTTIGAGCEIGPSSRLINATLGNGCRVISSVVDSSTLEDEVKVGPMSNVRPGCTLRKGAKIGDFVELKNSDIGEKTAVAHLTYVGDSDVGAGCNFGCGVVTVNYDGTSKFRTVVGDECFIGCNTNLVAPVTLGDRVYTAAGTTVTDDVPSESLVIGRAEQIIKRNWVKTKGRYRKK